jgi:hypothetical protein
MTKIILPVFALLLAIAVPGRPASVPEGAPWIVIVATSSSDLQFAAQARADIEEWMRSLKDGTPVRIYGLNSKITPVYAGRLDAAGRELIRQKLKELPYRRFTDITLGLTNAFGSAPDSDVAMPAVLILTDPKPVAPSHSAGVGKTLTQIMNDVVLVPDVLQVFLRIYGNDTAFKTTRSNVTLLAEKQAFAALIEKPQPKPPVEAAVEPPSTVAIWKFVVGGTLAIFMVAGLIVLRSLRRGGGPNPQEEAALMLMPVRPLVPAEPAVAPVAPSPVVERRGFVLRVDDDHLFHLDRGRPQIVLGDDWQSELDFEESGTAVIFQLDDSRHRLHLSNRGPGEIRIGEVRLAAGGTRSLPAQRVEIGLGHHLIVVLPEVLSEPELPAGAGDRMEGVSR